MTTERQPEGWFVSLKDAKTGKISELMIARTPESAEEWRAKGYIVRPFIYLAEPEGELRVCENCKHSTKTEHGFPDGFACSLIVQNWDNKHIPLLRNSTGYPVLCVPKDYYCKHWEKKDESIDPR